MRIRIVTLTALILLAAAARLIPHPPNFAPIMGIALFGGASFIDRRQAFLIPLLAMFLSDLALGFHNQMTLVYLCFAATVLIGRSLQKNRSVGRVAGAAFASSVLFFVATNFGVWLTGGLYPHTASGLATCYIAALPFLQTTLLGDALYTAAMFSGFALAERYFPVLRRPALAL